MSKIAMFGREMLSNPENNDSPAKFENFVLICITHRKMHHIIGAEGGANSRA
jgi:hypothetical protein